MKKIQSIDKFTARSSDSSRPFTARSFTASAPIKGKKRFTVYRRRCKCAAEGCSTHDPSVECDAYFYTKSRYGKKCLSCQRPQLGGRRACTIPDAKASGIRTREVMRGEKEDIPDDNVLLHRANEIRAMVSAASLTFLERGRIYTNFKKEFSLSDYQMSAIFDKDRSTISREIRLYNKSVEYDYKPDHKTPDRVMIRALELHTRKDSDDFMAMHAKYKDIDFSRLVSLINKSITPDQAIKELTEKYEAEVADIKRFKADRS